jgi:hypothetical protein
MLLSHYNVLEDAILPRRLAECQRGYQVSPAEPRTALDAIDITDRNWPIASGSLPRGAPHTI